MTIIQLTMGKQDKIVALIRRYGGEIHLSLLESRYKEVYGVDVGVPLNTTLHDWIKSFGSIRMKPSKNGGFIAFDFGFSAVQEENILTLIRKFGGEISLSGLGYHYKESYGISMQYPTGRLRNWVETFDSIGTRMKRNSKELVVFENPSRLQQLGINKERISDDVELESNGTAYLSMVGEATGEHQFHCAGVVEKLMSYVGGRFRPIIVHQDSLSLLDILPMQWSDALVQLGMEQVSDISLDTGRRPYCWHKYQRKYLCEDSSHKVEDRDVQEIVSNLQAFGEDNRAGIDGQLHRISCIRNNSSCVIGLTIRVGRHVEGNADMIRDLLEDSGKSILLLGEPGSGKTTIVRDVTKILSQKGNVFIVDTSNEIAGDGNIPHSCVGDARRMMVKSLPSQADTMIECVQNHTPSVMVIDEIGRKREVEAAQTSKNRGVRMIASAHGDLRSLVKNKDIRGLIGGLQTVTLGDTEAKELQKKTGSKTLQKQLTTRAMTPIFDTIIELKRGRLNEWDLIPDTAKAVDDILLGEKYNIQKRMRCMTSGKIFVECIQN